MEMEIALIKIVLGVIVKICGFRKKGYYELIS